MITTICAPLILFLVNRYLFSWTGFILNKIPSPFGCSWCDRKSIGVPVANGHSKILSFVIDLAKVASTLESKSNYHLINFGYRITAYRKFGRVWYHVSLYTYQYGCKTMTEMSLGTGTSLSLWRDGEPDIRGESCIVPNSWIKNRIYRMIDDLPLTKKQNAEVKKNVVVQCTGDAKSFF